MMIRLLCLGLDMVGYERERGNEGKEKAGCRWLCELRDIILDAG